MDPCPYLVKYSLYVIKTKFFFRYWIKSSGDMDKDPFSWNQQIFITDQNAKTGIHNLQFAGHLFKTRRVVLPYLYISNSIRYIKKETKVYLKSCRNPRQPDPAWSFPLCATLSWKSLSNSFPFSLKISRILKL